MTSRSDPSSRPLPESVRSRSRLVFFVFVLTFIASRIVVFLIMARRIPEVFIQESAVASAHQANLVFAGKTSASLSRR